MLAGSCSVLWPIAIFFGIVPCSTERAWSTDASEECKSSRRSESMPIPDRAESLLQLVHRRQLTAGTVDDGDVQALAVYEDTVDPSCQLGSHCATGMPEQRGACVHPGLSDRLYECWDICNQKHKPEEYLTGDSHFDKQFAEAVRIVRSGGYMYMSCESVTNAQAAFDVSGTLNFVKKALEAAEEARLVTRAAVLEARDLANASNEKRTEAAEVMQEAATAEANALKEARKAMKAVEKLAGQKAEQEAEELEEKRAIALAKSEEAVTKLKRQQELEAAAKEAEEAAINATVTVNIVQPQPYIEAVSEAEAAAVNGTANTTQPQQGSNSTITAIVNGTNNATLNITVNSTIETAVDVTVTQNQANLTEGAEQDSANLTDSDVDTRSNLTNVSKELANLTESDVDLQANLTNASKETSNKTMANRGISGNRTVIRNETQPNVTGDVRNETQPNVTGDVPEVIDCSPMAFAKLKDKLHHEEALALAAMRKEVQKGAEATNSSEAASEAQEKAKAAGNSSEEFREAKEKQAEAAKKTAEYKEATYEKMKAVASVKRTFAELKRKELTSKLLEHQAVDQKLSKRQVQVKKAEWQAQEAVRLEDDAAENLTEFAARQRAELDTLSEMEQRLAVEAEVAEATSQEAAANATEAELEEIAARAAAEEAARNAGQEGMEVCIWKPDPSCLRYFEYKGQNYTDCIDLDFTTPWCSPDAIFDGQVVFCLRSCHRESGISASEDIEMLPNLTVVPESGSTAPLNETGMQSVVDLHSIAEMEVFIVRVVVMNGLKIVNATGLMLESMKFINADNGTRNNESFATLKEDIDESASLGHVPEAWCGTSILVEHPEGTGLKSWGRAAPATHAELEKLGTSVLHEHV